MKNLIREIHRRSLWQVLGIYVAGSWVALQVVNEVVDSVALPEWISGAAVVLLIIGFPVVLATAFVQEGVGGSDRPQAAAPEPREASPAPSAEPTTAERRLPDRTPNAAVGSSTERGARHGIFTWRRAVMGGVGAFALLGLLMVGWVASRAFGIGPAATLVAQGVLDERATVLLADFETPDRDLSRAATEAFKVDLSQSHVVRLAEPSFVRQALERMQRDADDGLDPELADELAIREGIPAVIAGRISGAGVGYVLTAELRAAGSGEVLASHRETAADSTELIDALDALSKRIRERIGESVGTMRGEEPLERVTTANLDALRKYSQAIEAVEFDGDDDRGIELLEEAIAMDSAFAMAWRKLGAILSNRREERSRRVEALTRAFEHQDRLAERERYLAQASYYENVTEESRRAIRAYENMLEMDPDDIYALNNAGIVYLGLRDFEQAEELYKRALAADSTGLPPWFNLQVVLANQGKWEEARRTLDVMAERFPNAPQPTELGAWLASAQGDYEASEARFRELRQRQAGEPFWEAETATHLARLETVRGRLADAEGWAREAQRVAEDRGFMGQVIGHTVGLAFTDLRVRQDPAAAIRRIDDALDRYSLEDLDPLDRPYGGLIMAFAYAGGTGRARALLEEQAATVPPELLQSDDTERMEAAIALSEGRYEDALEGFRRTAVGSCLLCSMDGIALTHDMAGRPDSATVAYERYVETPFFNRLFFDATFLPFALERLGQLHDEAGRLQEAAEYYARFVELWADADQELQPRVRTAQARLEEILREIG